MKIKNDKIKHLLVETDSKLKRSKEELAISSRKWFLSKKRCG